MKKLLLFAILVFSIQLRAQDFSGFNQSNYAGVTGIYMQPASIADSRLKFDLNLVGVNVYAYNNYISLDRSALKKQGSWSDPTFPAFDDPNFQDKYLKERVNSKIKNLYFSNRIAGPSFLININRKNAIAFSTNLRNYVNIDGVSPELAKLAYEEFKYPTLWVTDLQNKNLSIQEMSWAEYGLTFAHVFKEDGEHYFKGGATVKLLQGIQSAYMFVSDLKYKFIADTTVSILQSQVRYGHSDNFDFDNVGLGTGNGTAVFDFSQSYPGVSFDFGAVYEWRPDYASYKYDMDGEKGLWRRDQNKYKLKVGISVTDLGSIKYKKGKTSNDFYANVGYWNLKPIDPKTVGELDDTLRRRFGNNSSSTSYRMQLPTAISAQIDYHVWKDVYLNLTPFVAFQFTKKETKVHDISSITLTPRWDAKWFGAFVPVQYNFLDGFRAGLALKLGPLVIGTSNVAPLVGLQKKIYGADIYTMLKFPLPYTSPRDRDKDGVSDKLDKCLDQPGVWEFTGCPDQDGDHIPDAQDKCPTIPGIKEMLGCPDKDGDGITDADDKCPEEKGLMEFQGCPDKDGDKITDADDECPDDPGLPEFFGCPDRDGDGTPDKYDGCPDVAGPKEFKGCPDKDGDTVLDKDDECPEIPGAVANKGCPWPDTDKDGVADREDDCPTVAGLKELKGCPPAPVLKVEEQRILEKAFSSLEFATGKDIIKKVSYPSLNELAKLMKQHAADWTLKLAGHTDNQGDAAKNMLLSEKRAKAVKKYLATKGVKADRILTEWHGQTMPVAPNDTEAGRQKNRRVEMKVVFK